MPDFLLENLETKTTKRLSIDDDRILIGRNPAAEIALKDSGVSKNHVLIERVGEDYTFRDLGSSNGTRHNNDDSTSGTLRHRDQLRIGRVRITILFDPSVERSATPPQASSRVPPTAPPSVVADSVSLPVPRETARGRIGRRGVVVLFIFIGTFVVGIGAGTTIGFFMRDEESSPATVDNETASHSPNANSSKPNASPGSEPPTTSALSPEENAIVARSHALTILNRQIPGLTRNPDARYSDHAESERTLFRMYLDILRRPPTRGELERQNGQGHIERWLTLEQSEPAVGSLTIEATFQTFLGRPASEEENKEIGSWTAEDLPFLGAVVTASHEYRAASHRREKDPRQLARSLFVDLRDEPEPSEDELLRVETILTGAAPSAARSTIARLLASSSILRDPRKEHDYTAESLVRWIQGETRRFLQRPVNSDELQALLERMQAPGVDLRWYRTALASSADYGSY